MIKKKIILLLLVIGSGVQEIDASSQELLKKSVGGLQFFWRWCCNGESMFQRGYTEVGHTFNAAKSVCDEGMPRLCIERFVSTVVVNPALLFVFEYGSKKILEAVTKKFNHRLSKYGEIKKIIYFFSPIVMQQLECAAFSSMLFFYLRLKRKTLFSGVNCYPEIKYNFKNFVSIVKRFAHEDFLKTKDTLACYRVLLSKKEIDFPKSFYELGNFFASNFLTKLVNFLLELPMKLKKSVKSEGIKQDTPPPFFTTLLSLAKGSLPGLLLFETPVNDLPFFWENFSSIDKQCNLYNALGMSIGRINCFKGVPFPSCAMVNVDAFKKSGEFAGMLAGASNLLIEMYMFTQGSAGNKNSEKKWHCRFLHYW